MEPESPVTKFAPGHIFDDECYIVKVGAETYIARDIDDDRTVRIGVGGDNELLCGGSRDVPENIKSMIPDAPETVDLSRAREILCSIRIDDFDRIEDIDLSEPGLEKSDEDDAPDPDDEYELDGFVVADSDEVKPAEADSRSRITDVDESNILPPGKRRRKSTRTIYEEPEFQAQLSETMLADVPADEIEAAVEENVDDCSETDGGTGSDYDEDEEPDEEYDNDDDDGSSEEESDIEVVSD